MAELSIEELRATEKLLRDSGMVVRTPLLKHMQTIYPCLDQDIDLYMKLENMQTEGCFKIRGITSQFQHMPDEIKNGTRVPVTMTAGNYGKTFGYLLKKRGLNGVCVMPTHAPKNRIKIIEDFGVETKIVPTEELQPAVDRLVEERNCMFLHSFDDPNLILGTASAGFEILDDLPDPDIVIVPCGGGSLLAGIAAAIKLSGKQGCKIYGVEPEQSCTMYDSLREGKPMASGGRSIAAGLTPPYAGKAPYEVCKKFVDGVFLVSDEEIIECVKLLYQRGLTIEPSGAAPMAALMFNKIPNVKGKKVVAVISGGNCSPEEMMEIFNT